MASRGLLPTVIDSVEQPVPTSKANEVGFLRLGRVFFENGSRSIGGNRWRCAREAPLSSRLRGAAWSARPVVSRKVAGSNPAGAAIFVGA